MQAAVVYELFQLVNVERQSLIEENHTVIAQVIERHELENRVRELKGLLKDEEDKSL